MKILNEDMVRHLRHLYCLMEVDDDEMGWRFMSLNERTQAIDRMLARFRKTFYDAKELET